MFRNECGTKAAIFENKKTVRLRTYKPYWQSCPYLLINRLLLFHLVYAVTYWLKLWQDWVVIGCGWSHADIIHEEVAVKGAIRGHFKL